MPKKLQDEDATEKVEFKLPATLKSQAREMAQADGDGDLSGWFRSLIREKWRQYQEGRRGKGGNGK